jgi:hypothetical protein
MHLTRHIREDLTHKAISITNIAAILSLVHFCSSGMSLWVVGFLSSQPVRTLTVMERDGTFFARAATMSHSFECLFINEDPHPRLHTTSIGQPQFKSYDEIILQTSTLRL